MDSGLERAKRVLMATLRAESEALPREVLLERVTQRAGVAARTFDRAIGAALADGEVEAIPLPKRGAPRLYRLPGSEVSGRGIESPFSHATDSTQTLGRGIESGE